jgi:hypothetical protein
VAIVYRTDIGAGFQTASWNNPLTPLILGYDALKIEIWYRNGASDWVNRATYISHVIIANTLQPSTWTFTLWTNRTASTSSFTFGNSQYKSGITGITFDTPLQSDIGLWRLGRGDYVGWILGEYLDVIGVAFYGLCLFLSASTLYFRYKHFGTVAFFFSVFGGPGGIIWLFLPAWGAAVGSALIILGLSFVVWRVIR